MRHWLRTVAAVFMCVAVLAGCNRDGVDSDGRKTVRFWAMGYEGEVVAQLIPEFERENPDIKIELQQIPWTSAHEKLLTSFAGETLPDVCSIGNTWIPEFAAIGALSPLDTKLAATPSVEPADFYPGAWDSGVVDGHIYAVPWYTEVRSVYYNEGLMQKAGITAAPESWAQWEASMPALKKLGNLSPMLLPLNEFEPLLNLSIQSDEPLLRDGNQYGNFRGAGFRKTLAFYHGMFSKGYSPILTNNQIANVWDEFGKGKINYYISGPWNIAEFRKRLTPNQLAQLRTMPLPGPDGKGASIAGGTSFVIFKSSRNPDAAWRWIEFLSRPSVQARFYSLTGDLPPRRSAWVQPNFNADPLTKAFQDQLERSKSAPKVPEWERIATEMKYIGEAVAHGTMTEDEAVKELDRRADKILAKRRWMISQGRSESQ